MNTGLNPLDFAPVSEAVPSAAPPVEATQVGKDEDFFGPKTDGDEWRTYYLTYFFLGDEDRVSSCFHLGSTKISQSSLSAADCCWLLPKSPIASGVPHFKTQFFGGQSHKRSSHWQICFPIPIISWVSLLQSLCIVSEVLGKLPDCHRSNTLFFLGFFETWQSRIHHL